MEKNYGYTVIFSNGLANSGTNVKAKSERDVIKSILNDHFIADQTIVSITVVEQNR